MLNNLRKHPNSNGYILDLKMSNISSLSSILETIKPSDISELILSYNSLKNIEEFILNMKNLLTLNVSVNQLKEIPPFENFKNLESLNLSTNRIVQIKNLEGLNSLTRLVNYYKIIPLLAISKNY